MRFLLVFAAGIFLISSCTTTKEINQDQAKNFTYFDRHYQKISKKKFDSLVRTNIMLLNVQGDLPSHRLLVYREKFGVLNQKEAFFKQLENQLNILIDTLKPLVIFYYPGKDPCNSTGLVNQTKSRMTNKFTEIEKNLNNITPVQLLLIFKDSTGLQITSRKFTWKLDPGKVVEHTFFKYHYPCGSYVIIDKNGQYTSYFGEYSVFTLARSLKKLVALRSSNLLK